MPFGEYSPVPLCATKPDSAHRNIFNKCVAWGARCRSDFSRLNLTVGMRKSSVFAIGGRSSMVEPQIVVLAVAGSSPVGHPILKVSGFGLNSEFLKTRSNSKRGTRNSKQFLHP